MSDKKYIFKPFNGKENEVCFTSDELCHHIKHFDNNSKYHY